jgi:hypothetical protein
MAILMSACTDILVLDQDSTSFAAVSGVVLNGEGHPLADVRVDAVNLRRDCEAASEYVGRLSSARTDEDGEFQMTLELFLWAPGSYCLDFEVDLSDLAHFESGIEFEAFLRDPPADTALVTLTTPW